MFSLYDNKYPKYYQHIFIKDNLEIYPNIAVEDGCIFTFSRTSASDCQLTLNEELEFKNYVKTVLQNAHINK